MKRIALHLLTLTLLLSTATWAQDVPPVTAQPTTPVETRSLADPFDMEKQIRELQNQNLQMRQEIAELKSTRADSLLFLASVLVALGTLVIAIFAIALPWMAYRQQTAAKEDMDKTLQKAEKVLAQIEKNKETSDTLLSGMTAEDAEKEDFKQAASNTLQDPGSSYLLRAVASATVLQRNGQIEEAIEKWRAIANITREADKNQAARALFSIGYLYQAYQDKIDLPPNMLNEKAIESYTGAIGLKPDYADAYNNRGVAKETLGQYESAIADFSEVLVIEPNAAHVYCNLGEVKGKMGNHEGAREDFNIAMKLAREQSNHVLIALIEKMLAELGSHSKDGDS